MEKETNADRAATLSGSPFSWIEARVVERTRSARYARVALEGSGLPHAVGAGQFILVRYGEDPCLPRAFSVMSAGDGTLDLFVKSEGRVREKLSTCPIGTTFSVRGPYGTPYDRRIAADRPYVLVAGGSGIAPMLFFAEQHPALFAASAYGFRTRDACDVLPGVPLIIEEVTGERAIDRVDSLWKPGYGILACGPESMLRALARAYRSESHVYVSLEARVGCGIGTCLGCRVATSRGPKRICVDGPLFSAEELTWLT